MKGWTDFTIIYEGSEHLPNLDSVLAIQDLISGEDISMTVVQLPDSDDFRYTDNIYKPVTLNEQMVMN